MHSNRLGRRRFCYAGDLSLAPLRGALPSPKGEGICRLDELRKAAESEGVALNQLINVAVAEKVSALRTEEYFRERGRRADGAETLRILERAGKGNPPWEGDELPPELRKKPGRKVTNGRDSVSRRGQKKRAPVR